MSSVQNPSDSLQRPGTSCSHPQPSLLSSSPPHIPQIQITGSQISQESDITRHNQRRRLMGSYSQPRATAQTELCEDCGDSKKPRSFFSRAIGSIHRKLSPNRGKSSTPVPPPEQDVNDQRATLNTDHNTDSTSVHAQLRHKGINVPPFSELAAAPLSSSDTGRKKTIIGATRLILQSAVSALRFSPVPNLDAIPNLLLTWLQLYETVDGNDENLKGLNDEVKRAYTTILQPLQMWTSQAGEIPPEVVSLIKEFHSDLEEQVRRIKFLESQKVGKRVISATEITQKIADVKACVANAVSHFATVATTLNLLSTIRTSVNYELSKLAKADAEYFSVKSKSECLETTRDKIRSSILDHLKDPKNRFVWLRGSPGTGKTAVSLSVASTLDNQGCLAASFFWDKNQQGTGLDSIERFPSTLALQLAEFSPEYKSLLIRELRHPQSLKKVQGPVLEKQMQAWIINPIRQLGDILSSEKDRFIIILDGLDECGDPGTLESLMKLVLLLHKLPSAFAALVSCRPETQVVTAWDDARDQGLIIPCEDVDKISKDETFHTIRLMVEEGLRDCIKKSTWKPASEDLDAFAFACRGLPIMASIRVRDVALQTRHGRTLQSEFRHLCNLIHAPADLNSEYLRILHRAYMPDRSRIHPEVAKNYHAVISTMVTAPVAFSVHGMSQILEISEDEIRATLEPISSMVDLPSDNAEDIKFYHATAREFVTGDPIGEGSDQVFFIHGDKYFLGLPLLRFINGISERNGLDIPIELPLGDEKKWKSFVTKQWPIHVNYAFNRLFLHLDPSALLSDESNELQREFNRLLTRNLLSYIVMVPTRAVYVQDELVDHFPILGEALRTLFHGHVSRDRPWQLYRSCLPLTPSSSPFYELYGHLSDPIRVFSTSGVFSGHFIPLDEDTLGARKTMEAELSELPKKVERWDREVPDYEAEFANRDIHKGIVTCATLSRDGRSAALGFGSGTIEVADIDHQRTISRFQCSPSNHPVWVEFCNGNRQIATEDSSGNITIFSPSTQPVKLGAFPSGPYPAITAVSNSGALVLRVPRNLDGDWYEHTALLYVSDDSSIGLLSPPSTLPAPSTPLPAPSTPLRHMLGFSPENRYVGACGGNYAFVWSTDSRELITRYHVLDPETWIPNIGVAPPCSHHIPSPMLPEYATPLGNITDVRNLGPDLENSNPDESWLKCPYYDLSPSMGGKAPFTRREVYSSAIGKAPLVLYREIWFNGKVELTLPLQYGPVVENESSAGTQEAWYGDRVSIKDTLRRPQTSEDGTRWLVQGQMKAPILVDTSRVL